MSHVKIVAMDLGSPDGDRAIEAEWRDGKLVSYRELCKECSGTGMTTYAKRGLYQTTCRRCWGEGHVLQKSKEST